MVQKEPNTNGSPSPLGVTVYFAHPYRSWELGTNENTQGRVRQYFPKHRDLSMVTRMKLDHATGRLDHCPRKRLGFRTPYEVFFQIRTSLTAALPTCNLNPRSLTWPAVRAIIGTCLLIELTGFRNSRPRRSMNGCGLVVPQKTKVEASNE